MEVNKEFERIKGQLEDIQKDINDVPIRVIMNQHYYDSLNAINVTINEKPTTIFGIELEIDNDVETYEFVYK